jgi:hypothetical protein
MTGEIGADVEDVVRQVKEAVAAVQAAQAERGPDAAAVEVVRVDLTIRTVATRSGGGEISVRVPFVGQDLGGGVAVSREQVQTVQLSLVPPTLVAKGTRRWDVSAELVAAILGIEDGLRRSAAAEPRFELDTAAVELNLVLGRDGRLSLLGRGSAGRELTHTVKLHLKRIAAAR